MNATTLAAFALVFAAAFGIVRTWRDARPRRALRIALQLATAALLGLCLFPPRSPVDFAVGELVVLTPGATTAQLAAVPAADGVVALPGAAAGRAIERAPDLGTALRRHPDARRLHVVGGGLPARDRDAARGLAIRFDAAPLPRGVVELDAPRAVRAGNAWRIEGRVEGAPGARMTLRDPSAAVAASTTADAQGRFALETFAKGEGSATFTLKAEGSDGAPLDEIVLPLVMQAGSPVRVLLLAAAPDAESKYLRRWAVDAGVEIDSRIGLSEGIGMTEGAPGVDAAMLAETDVAIVDERAWAALGPAQKDALRAAVDDGLGLLLRMTSMPPPAVVEDWAALGFRVDAVDGTAAPVALDRALALATAGFAFTRAALDLQAVDATPLLRADDGTLLAAWRAQGRGRVAAWTLLDAYRLRLQGDGARHAALWSDVLATLARPRAAPQPSIGADGTDARVDRRIALCGIDAGDHVDPPQGDAVPLEVVDRDGRACAGYWPAMPGWHVLVSNGARHPFHVRGVGEAGALAAAADAAATRALAGDPAGTPSASASREVAWPRWPFFLAWLAAAALLWALERTRTGSVTAGGR
jgi:hypothetical protein